MIRKINTLLKISEVGLVAVVRAEDAEKAEKTALACMAGGISAIEITFTVPGADQVIKHLKKSLASENLILGAGTVLDSETARIAILAGSEFIVSPTFDLDTAKLCNRYQIPYMPGCMTTTEMVKALEAGADIIKLFPGDAYGPNFVKSVRGPLPHVAIMPTGGVNLENVGSWIKNGCIAVGVGGELTKEAKNGRYDLVTETAKQFVKKIQEARGR
ncbi:bifunctional 2-keto-4-hydroxyglutarate aldolase/2-keto-3-deoxy-6-phosphogluconate aldolase [Sinanaerobacter sp. ZZT-01]|uniref:bifunctional 2-keto-4-hydroxyglutarate aldolase/2-keto-3-deoxy-6-phosphogluconate aldolase n=1 Tax=Sinanaerobacter sp. ZZT-01 TaxID=3111540 RepID=UPI002D7789D8|nr:bifunctional 2-keto-4-hydroxyglutarate aldolase/2-keto-3-deoxy-6-phosphogluconate aldolase [Sinanaerobacter sp. ZZT-01]WRR92410.1 bifunctional 2-keto-4-hydroxyglutarate aldolase/2-keto-3-deoxy-6-phosphogluconate aldolase [Sinanaerobacter sp. ZZT-01]